LDAALPEQLAQGPAEVGVLVLRHAEFARQRLGLERLVALARHRGQDSLAEVGHESAVGHRPESTGQRPSPFGPKDLVSSFWPTADGRSPTADLNRRRWSDWLNGVQAEALLRSSSMSRTKVCTLASRLSR